MSARRSPTLRLGPLRPTKPRLRPLPKWGPLPLIDDWRIVERGPGPYVIEGTLGGEPLREAVLALTLDHGGIACLADRWLALGTRAAGGLSIVDEDAVLARTAAWVRAAAATPAGAGRRAGCAGSSPYPRRSRSR